MKIERTFKITRIVGQDIKNAPYEIVAENTKIIKDCEASFTLDKKTCIKYAIDMSLDLVGKELKVWLESVDDIGDEELFSSFDFLEIKLEKTETACFQTAMNNYGSTSEFRILKLISCRSEGDGIHPYELPCPLYKINFQITEEEYNKCKNLHEYAFFKLKNLSIS